MASNSSTKTKIIDEFQVSPPTGSVPDSSSIPLSFFDVAWLFTGPVERLFFFSLPISTVDFKLTHIPALQSSLSETLRQFYPLAGRVRPCPEMTPDNQFEFYFCANDTIPFSLAESSSDFDELTGNEMKDFTGLYSLVPQLPRANDGTIPLTAIQVTVFPGKGICIGVAMHHVACDDSSFMHFVKSWASSCRVEPVKASGLPPPLFDRAIISDPNQLYSKTLSEMKEILSKGPPPASESPSPLNQSRPLISTFVLTREQIDALKEGLIAKSDGPPLHCSSFTVACAYAWVCLIKSQETITDNSITEKSAHLLFSVDCRSRLQPLIPTGYFGNCLRPCFVEANLQELHLQGGVFTAAMAIGKAIKGLDEGVLQGAEGWFRKILSLVPNRPMSVGGSPRYRVYDVDFGWGRPMKVELPSIGHTPGTVSLAESRDGKGGIEIGVVLPENEMQQFELCFSNGILYV
ncbi:malonyl-coenzyme A:anthocyanin 3-O-glucoside-6''-O-malonyltransferase-like [Carex rostrata]